MANTSLPGEWHHALPVHVRARRGELEDTLTKDAVIDYLTKYMTKSLTKIPPSQALLARTPGGRMRDFSL